MSIQTTCCFTGHRDLQLPNLRYIIKLLSQEIQSAYADGYTHFIMGGAEGADLLFAKLVCNFREQGHALTLEAAPISLLDMPGQWNVNLKSYKYSL